jgi:hypothetical protein
MLRDARGAAPPDAGLGTLRGRVRVVESIVVPLLSAERSFSLTVERSATVSELTSLIAERFDVPPASLTLQHRRHSLRERARIADVGAAPGDPIVVCARSDSARRGSEEDCAEAKRPENYDELIKKLAVESRQPLRICKWCFDRHNYAYDAAFTELTSVG